MDLRKKILLSLSVALIATSRAEGAVEANSIIVRCLEGTCFLRRHASIYVEIIDQGDEVTAARGDTVMTIDQGSLLEVDFGEHKGQAYLRDTTLAQITQGAERIILQEQGTNNFQSGKTTEQTRETARDQARQGDTAVRILPSVSAGNLSFFQDLSVDLVTPPSSGALLLEKFPAQAQIVIAVSDPALRESFLERHARWVLQLGEPESQSTVAPPQNLEFHAIDGSKTKFFANVLWQQPGHYRLLPLGPSGAPSPDSALRIRVSDPQNWENEIQTLIDHSSENPNGHIEIRQDSH